MFLIQKIKNKYHTPSHVVFHILLSIICIYCFIWLVLFGLLKQSQQNWGFLYDQQQNSINAAAELSSLPPSMFSDHRSHPWPKDKVVSIDSGWPPNSISPNIWDLLSTQQQVISGEKGMMESIDAQTSYLDSTLPKLKR